MSCGSPGGERCMICPGSSDKEIGQVESELWSWQLQEELSFNGAWDEIKD